MELAAVWIMEAAQLYSSPAEISVNVRTNFRREDPGWFIESWRSDYARFEKQTKGNSNEIDSINPNCRSSLLAVLAMPAQIMAQGEQEHKPEHFPHYTVTDLGTLGGTYSYAFGLNNAGQVAGGSATPNQTDAISQTAFLWTQQTGMQDLGTLGGFNTVLNSSAGGPNARGEAALVSETFMTDPNGEDVCGFGTQRQCLGAIWKDGVMTALSTMGGNNSAAFWINSQGQVVGFAENQKPEEKGSCLTAAQTLDFEAVIWEPNGDIRELPPLPGDTVGFAFGINDRGQTVAASGSCANTAYPPAGTPMGPNGRHAVLWERDRSPHDLGNLGGTSNIASSINNRGDVVGTSQSSKDGNIHGFLWTRESGMQDLGTLPGAIATVPPCCHTINERGELVGFSIDANFNSRAFVWQNGVMIDLNALIPKNSAWYLQTAESINDAGRIAGYGTINGETHAFLATPCHRHGDRQCCEAHDR